MAKTIEEYKVLLINPPYPGKTQDPALSLGYLGAMVKRLGVRIYIWNGEVVYSYKEKFYEVINLVKDLKPDIVGFSLTTPFVRYAYNLANKINDMFDVPLIAGGTHASIYPKEILEKSAFEIAVIGEGEYAIVDLIEYFRKEKSLEDIPGIAYKNIKGDILLNEPRPFIRDLDELPFPLDSQTILRDNKGGIFGQILTSRGCPAGCIFCGSVVHGRRFRFRTAENVFEEMLHFHKRCGVSYYRFHDDAISINQPRLEKLCDIIINYPYSRFTWGCQTRADMLSPGLLRKMQEAGCIELNVGLETVNPHIMKNIKKNISLDKVLKVIEDCGRIKLPLNINLMAGFPFETKDDIRQNLAFARKVSKKIERLSTGLVVRPYPGTEIYDTYNETYGFSKWWLNDKFTLPVNIDYIPLYLSTRLGTWTVPEDPTLDYNFFKYPPDIKREIKRFVRYKAWFSMKKCHGLIRTAVILQLFYLSKYLYRIAPSLEKTLMVKLLKFGQWINYLAELVKSGQIYFAITRSVKTCLRSILDRTYLLFSRPDKFIRYFINRLFFKFCPLVNGRAGWPVAFYITINNRCIFKCKTCDVGQRQTETLLYKKMVAYNELTLDEWRKIIDKVAYLRPYIEISAVEPLLYKDILGVIDFIKSTKKLELSVTTNGFLLKRYAHDLTRLMVDRIIVSIDGPREIHDEIRGVKGSFDMAIEGIDALCSNRKHPCLEINYTISDNNYLYLFETIEKLSNFAKWNVFRFIHLSFVTDEMARLQNGKFPDYKMTPIDISGVDLNKIDIWVLTEQIKQIYHRYKDRDIVFHPNIPINKIEDYYRNPSKFVLKKNCIFPWISASILSNGDIVALNRCPGDSFGNLLKEDFKDIWNNEKFRKFRMVLKEKGPFPICSRCGALKLK